MEEKKENIYYKLLVQRFKENKANDEELELFFHLVHDGKLDHWLKESMNQEAGIESLSPVLNIKKSIIYNSKRMMAVAAVFLLFLASAVILFINNKGKQEIANVQQKLKQSDIPAGKYKAVLQLANGEKIILDSASNGQLAKQGNSYVFNKNGKLAYNYGDQSTIDNILYNTLTTSRGETYSLTLADGSQVWLNSASSIHFPLSFPGKERRIEITGEVYVKVAKNPAKPFIVSTNGMEVLALGTEFNINSYNDEENITTTLIEGTVKVSKGASNSILEPGQQIQIHSNGQIAVEKDIDVEEITAWKDGYFHFESANLKTILRQFSRWYDVEVIYEGVISKENYFGIMKRNMSLNSVLNTLKANGIKFRIEGKKLIVQQE